MYTPGKLLYFDPFYFNNGTSKPKYFLVLKVIENGTAILATLPSSVNHLPQLVSLVHGCIDVQNIGVNCYLFEADRPITKCGWSFPRLTMLYGNWIADFSINTLATNHPIEKVDYEIIGELTETELKSVIECFKNSSVVRRKYKRLLSE